MAILNLMDDNFKEFIMKTKTPVLVDFWADWCGPCKMINSVIEEVADEFAGKVQIGKMNVDENQDTLIDLKITSIPTLVFFKDGQEVERSIGFKTKEEVENILGRYM